jgi:P4 family phage/plasmid primase-like protien
MNAASTHPIDSRSGRLSTEHLAKVRTSALSDEQISALGWSSLHTGSLLIPYRRPDGSPEHCHDGSPFTRERLSQQQINERKRKGDSNPGKYRSPYGEGCRVYHSALAIQRGNYPQRLNDRFTALRITEGELKTEAATAHDPRRVTVGLGGVSSWRDRYDDSEGDSRPLVDWDEIPLDGREVRLCFDSDIQKPQVAAALKALSEFLLSKGAHVLIELLPHDLNGDRLGIDDLIYRHGPEAFQRLAAIARSPFKTCRRDGQDVTVWAFNPEPLESHHKAVMAWSVFKTSYAIRPGFGLYRWQSNHWAPVDGKGAEPLNAPIHDWMDLMGWEKRSSALFGSARNEIAARLERNGWDPQHVMAFENGTLDTASGQFTPGHRLEDLLTFAFPFAYDAAAQCPRWERFLAETIENDELIQLLRAAIRWSLMPKDRTQPFRHELAFDAHGRRGTGKGTLQEVLQAICGGRRGAGLVKSQSFSNPNALYSLIGKRVAIDPDASGRVSDPGTFNNVVSNEPVEVKKLYSDVGSDRLGVVVWRFFNDQPGASGGGLEGMGRRLVTFRFTKQIDSPDRQLKEKLITESAGIFHWAWSMDEQAMHDLLSDVGAIKAVKEAAVDAAMEREPILRFLVEAFPQGGQLAGLSLFSQWQDWAREQGHEPGSNTRFGREVKKLSAVTFDKGEKGARYVIKPMAEFDLAAHLGIAQPVRQPVSQPVRNPSAAQQPSGDPWADQPLSTNPDGFNPSANPNPSANSSGPNPLQELGSDDDLTGLTGLSSQLRIQSQDCIDLNSPNPYSNGVGLKPVRPVSHEIEGTSRPLESADQSARYLPVKGSGKPGYRLPGALPKPKNAQVPVCCPDGRTRSFERRLIELDHAAA